jgi:hypothetical protein
MRTGVLIAALVALSPGCGGAETDETQYTDNIEVPEMVLLGDGAGGAPAAVLTLGEVGPLDVPPLELAFGKITRIAVESLSLSIHGAHSPGADWSFLNAEGTGLIVCEVVHPDGGAEEILRFDGIDRTIAPGQAVLTLTPTADAPDLRGFFWPGGAIVLRFTFQADHTTAQDLYFTGLLTVVTVVETKTLY